MRGETTWPGRLGGRVAYEQLRQSRSVETPGTLRAQAMWIDSHSVVSVRDASWTAHLALRCT